MGKPTNLPGFNTLANKIAHGSGKTLDPSKDIPEQFLGELEKQDIPVQKLASDHLTTQNLQPNQYHRNVVELFPENSLKIVTTNYDLMFEEVCNQMNIETNVYNNPAFPRGNNFSGIVHLHGRVKDFENMILTDSDFGRAYMVNGEASRFLSQLFSSDYTVLFIGYSYNDTVLRYFTRALPDLSGEKRYIFSSETERKSHEFLGLTPINYESGDYENLYDTILQIGTFSNRNSSSWDERITEISSMNVNKIGLAENDEIEYIFRNTYLLEQFLNNIEGPDWFYYLYKNNYFNFLFKSSGLNQTEGLLMSWVLSNFVYDDCQEIIDICLENSFNLNNSFELTLAKQIASQKISINALKKFVALIKVEQLDDITVYSLIEKLSNYEGFEKTISNLLKKTLSFEYSYDKPYWEIEENSHEINVSVKMELVISIWKFIKNKNLDFKSISETITSELVDLENKAILGNVEHNFSPLVSFLSESEYIDNKTKYTKFFIEILEEINKTNPNYIKNWVYKYISSQLSILRRISTYFINYIDDMPPKEKWC